MLRVVAIILSILAATVSTRAQFVPVPFDARGSAMGGVVLEYADDTLRSLTLNHRQGYALAGMATRGITLRWPVGLRGTIKSHYLYFGDSDYHEQQLAAGYRLRVTDRLSVGVRGRYCTAGTSDGHYETHRWMSLGVVAAYAVNHRLQLAMDAGTRPWDAARPWGMHLGMRYRMQNGLTAQMEVEGEETVRVHLGVEYGYGEHFLFRCGVSTRPLVLAFGAGFRMRKWHVDLSVESRQPLGLTPQITAGVCF